MSEILVEEEGKKEQSLFSKIFKIAFPLVLGLVILYFLYRDTDFDEMWSLIKDANFGIILFSLLFGLLGNTIRGIRWQLLIDPLGYKTKKFNLVCAVLGSYAINFVLPRAGEVWRCGVIAKKENIPFSKLFGTLLVDRMFDAVMVGTIVLLSFALNAQAFVSNQSMFQIPAFLTSVWFYVGVVLFIAVLVSMLYFFRSVGFIAKINAFLLSVWDVLKNAWKMKHKLRFLFYTVSIWICYFFFFYTTFYAFDFTKNLGFSVGLFVFAISSVSMVIPSNGGLGPWQAAVILSLGIFAVKESEATAFATAVFTVQSLWQVLYGLFGIFSLSFSSKKK